MITNKKRWLPAAPVTRTRTGSLAIVFWIKEWSLFEECCEE